MTKDGAHRGGAPTAVNRPTTSPNIKRLACEESVGATLRGCPGQTQSAPTCKFGRAMTKGGAPWLMVGWEVLQDWTGSEVIQQDDWNLIEISAWGETFSISINHQPVMSFTDSRLASGSVAILIDIYAQEPGQIEFDFFALQSR